MASEDDPGTPEWIGVVSFEMSWDEEGNPDRVTAVTAAREHPCGDMTEVYLPEACRIEPPDADGRDGFLAVGLCASREWEDGNGLSDRYELAHRVWATTDEEPAWFSEDVSDEYPSVTAKEQ